MIGTATCGSSSSWIVAIFAYLIRFSFAARPEVSSFEINTENSNGPEEEKKINNMLRLRQKWQGAFHEIARASGKVSPVNNDPASYASDLGQGRLQTTSTTFTLEDFNRDLKTLENYEKDGELWSFAKKALGDITLKSKSKRFAEAEEERKQSEELSKDYISAAKADNHIHHSAAMSQEHLLDFMNSVLRQSHHVEAIKASRLLVGGSDYEFNELVKRASNGTLTLAALDVFAHNDVFGRFDVFNTKYEPFGMNELRAIFLKPSTFISVTFPGGVKREVCYMAELTIDVCTHLPKEYFPEWRLSHYGRDASEWAGLEKFLHYKAQRSQEHWYGMFEKPYADDRTLAEVCKSQVKWMIQVPRIFSLPMFEGKTFASYLANVFEPIMKADKSVQAVLPYISGMDSVDDETKDNGEQLSTLPADVTWTSAEDSVLPFSYYMYLMAIGTAASNLMNPEAKLSFRPHCGEGGSPRHLLACYLLADQIQHGTELQNTILMQYMYFLSQVPVSMSVTSNHWLVRKLEESPFDNLFNLGLFITLSTDDPLIFFENDDEHECLLHEYQLSQKLFDLTWVDLAEVAFNSIMMSGYSDDQKDQMTGIEKVSRFLHWPTVEVSESLSGVPRSRFVWRRMLWCNQLEGFAEAEAMIKENCPT